MRESEVWFRNLIYNNSNWLIGFELTTSYWNIAGVNQLTWANPDTIGDKAAYHLALSIEKER